MKRVLCVIMCLIFAVSAPLCAFAETQNVIPSHAEQETTAEGDSDIVALAPAQTSDLKNIIMICLMGSVIIAFSLIYIARARKQLNSRKGDQ